MSWAARWAAWILKGYQQVVSPVLPRACRFEPTCSEFTRQVVLGHGVTRGFWLGLRRLARCHPLHPGGYDPPPDARGERPDRDNVTPWKNGQSWPRS